MYLCSLSPSLLASSAETRLFRIRHLRSALVSSVSKGWKVLVARTCTDAEFVMSVLNFWNISSPWRCLLTGKPLAGKVVQHLCVFVGCIVAGQTTELTWKCASKAGERMQWAALTLWYPRKLQEALFVVISSLHERKAPFGMCFLPKGTTASELLSQLTTFTFFFPENIPTLCVQQRRRNSFYSGEIMKHGE